MVVNVTERRPNLGFVQDRTEPYVAAFFEYCKARGLAEATLDIYRWALSHLPDTLPTAPEDMDRLLAAARETLAPESVYNIWRVLKTFYIWAAKRYGVPNPMEDIRKPMTETKLPKYLSRGNLFALLNAVESVSGKNGYYHSLSLRNKLLILTPLDTGLRLAEGRGIEKSRPGAHRPGDGEGQNRARSSNYTRPEGRIGIDRRYRTHLA